MGNSHRRRQTYNVPGLAHELTFSCYHKYPFLGADRTCLWLVEAIEEARVVWELDVWAYVFMPDHVHLIVRPRREEYRISAILKAIKEPVSRRATSFLVGRSPEWLDRITRRRGHRVERHFWQPGGGCDRNVTEPRTLMAMIAYIHLNPVRRGLADRARDFRWSSAAWYEDAGPCDLKPDPIPPEWSDGASDHTSGPS
jgi:putative transposase